MAKHKWEIVFDLDTKLLQKNYPGGNWRKAYKDISVFMKNNGFEHRQGSGYISKEPLHELQVDKKIKELATSCKWLDKCVKEIDKTMANERVSCKDIIHKTVQELDNESQSVLAEIMTGQHINDKKENAKEKPTQKFMYSRKKLNQKAQEIAKQPQQTTDKAKSKNKNIDI